MIKKTFMKWAVSIEIDYLETSCFLVKFLILNNFTKNQIFHRLLGVSYDRFTIN